MINIRQIITGIVILLTGAMVYITDRPEDSARFIRFFCSDLSLYGIIPSVFGMYGNNLPAFAHVFAFSLMTAGFVKAKKAAYFRICLFWVFINTLFEVGQKYRAISSKLFLPEAVKSFCLNGTFDYLDIYAFIAGGTLAYTFLIFTGNKESAYEAL